MVYQAEVTRPPVNCPLRIGPFRHGRARQIESPRCNECRRDATTCENKGRLGAVNISMVEGATDLSLPEPDRPCQVGLRRPKHAH